MSNIYLSKRVDPLNFGHTPMPLAWTLVKCFLLLLLGLTMGLVVSTLGMLCVAAINKWDDAPGGGILILLALLVGVTAGLVCGVFMAVSFWKYERLKNKNGIRFVHAVSGALALLSAISIAPSAFFLPFTSPVVPSQHRLSNGMGAALAVASICLFYMTMRHLIAHAKQFEQSRLF